MLMDFLAALLATARIAVAGDVTSLTEATNAIADARSLGDLHQVLGSEPHVAGTPADERQVARIAEYFAGLGLDVEVHRFHPLLARPIEARLEILGEPLPEGGRRGVLALDLRERNLLEDPSTSHPDLTYGWNAYSGSGDVTAPVVYANYGTREDFAALKKAGIDVRGKIVLTRYGGNFRGYKAKFAEEEGAAGLLIYTDPGDAGFTKGPTWPDGGWANDTCIQRGSIVTLPWPGDPLTPGIEATRDATRLDVAAIDLPTIPVQPIGYAAAERIVARMKGAEVTDATWKGGLRQTYRLEGGPDLLLRLVVRQERFVGESANVIATLRGATKPDELVIVGCHHDAWGFGAADPLAGTMVLLESARSFAEAARKGNRPDRTVLFCAWGAEEFGIIGSTEWVESRRDQLTRDAVAYVNLDMAAMGDRFGSSASPTLRPAIERAVSRAESPFTSSPIADAFKVNGKVPETGASFGDVGGGSDHVGFWCHAGVPSCSLGAGGSNGTSYHSNYDTVTWYRATVGSDYRAALLVTRATNAVVAEFAAAPLPPVSPLALTRDLLRLIRAAEDRAAKAGVRGDFAALSSFVESLVPVAERTEAVIAEASSRGGDAELSRRLREFTALWLDDAGLPNRPWFRNVYAATDRHSGYAPSLVPLLNEAIEDRDEAALAAAIERYRQIAVRMQELLRMLGER